MLLELGGESLGFGVVPGALGGRDGRGEGDLAGLVLGGGIGVAASAFMVLAVFRYPEGTGAARIAWGFYLGQFLKVALSIALLIVAFGAEGAVPVALLAGYGATFVGYWAAPRLPLSRR